MKKIDRRPLVLIVIEGLGHSNSHEGNAVALAHTPFYDEIRQNYPFTLLKASGEDVGLPKDSPGDAQVGYMNIGAGRIVKTDIMRIKQHIENGRFYENKVLIEAMQKATTSSLHLVGLLSNAEVHSSQEVLFALLRMAKNHGVTNVFVHGILDGKDVPIRTADAFVEAVEVKMTEIQIGKIATLCGRYYAMDKDENWELTARVYTMLVYSEGERIKDAVTAVRRSFLRGISDEYIRPIVLEDEEGNPIGSIKDGDVVIFFNHRGDGMRQLVRALLRDELHTNRPATHMVCLTEYDENLSLPVAFPKEPHQNVLAEVFSNYNIKNCRIAEGDKIHFVSDFFNVGFKADDERRVIIPAVKNYMLAPEMASFKITDAVLQRIEADEEDVFIVDFSAPDVLASSGDLQRTIESIQFVDTCIGAIVKRVLQIDGVVVLTSTHGHCEELLTFNGKNPAITSFNKVPFHLIDKRSNGIKLREEGSLRDVAPTILGILGISKPDEMTGEDLRENV